MERWQQVEEIFHEALRRDPAEREEYLRQACRGDSDLRREVASLLAHHSADPRSGPWAAAAAARLVNSSTSLEPGESLGPYRIESFVAAGGMGEVYRATDTRLKREVAIKVSGGRFSERFAQEASVIASLNHPHICHLYDVGPNYLVMELVEGTPLRGPLPLKQALEYAGQILDALDAAHRKGITHRDLKPPNILVTKQGVKLLDFGLAKRSGPLQESDATLTSALTGKGEILGTLQYMSPEQLQGKEADARSDLFSFGCVLYEMLTGKRAFEGESAGSVIAAILEREPAPLNLAPPLERVIRTCLAKDPDQRLQNALDLKRDLQWASEQPVAPAANHRTWIGAAAVMVAVVALAGWALFLFRQPAAADRVLRLQIAPSPAGGFMGSYTTGGVAISPDGKTAAYVASVNGKIGLWLRPLDSAAARLIPGTENASWPFWSPDGKSVGYIIARGAVARVELAGGMRMQITDFSTLILRGGSWSDDGKIIYGALPGLFLVPASGGKAVLLVKPDTSRGEDAYSWPQVLPGGRFLYFVQSANAGIRGVYAAPLDKPADRVKVLSTDGNAVYAAGQKGEGYLLWARSGELLAQEFNPRSLTVAGDPIPIAEAFDLTSSDGRLEVAASANGILLYGATEAAAQLRWVDRAGRHLADLGEPRLAIHMFRLSPDERRVAVQYGAGGGSDLWLLDADRGVPSRLTAEPGYNTQPVWSPDGRVIVFTRIGRQVILRKPANGIGEEQVVTERPGISLPTDWSRDGRWILLRETGPETKYDIWKIPVTPDGRLRQDEPPAPYLRTRFTESQARFSPEPSPRWVAYTSNESGQFEIYIDAFPEPRGRRRISNAGGGSPQWGPDGRELYYVSLDNKLMAVDLKLGADTVQSSAPRELFPLSLRSAAGATYQVSQDGKRFMVLANAKTVSQPLNVIVNWPALLKKATPAP